VDLYKLHPGDDDASGVGEFSIMPKDRNPLWNYLDGTVVSIFMILSAREDCRGLFSELRVRSICISTIAILASAGSLYACDCSNPPLEDIRARADVVFRGTIVSLRPAVGPQGFGDTLDTGKVAVFRVTRVWKGEVGPMFEMPALEETSACWGFWPKLLKAGNDLLVFAFRIPDATGGFIFETGICSRTATAKDNADIQALGLGYEPAIPTGVKPYKPYLRLAAVTIMILLVLLYLIHARSSRADHP
jgi:hypothetical protein